MFFGELCRPIRKQLRLPENTISFNWQGTKGATDCIIVPTFLREKNPQSSKDVPCCVNLRWLSTVITHRSHFLCCWLQPAWHSPSSSPHAPERQNLPTEYLPNCWSYYVFALTIGDTLNVMAQYGLVKMKDTLDNIMMGHSCGQSGGIKNSGWSPPH